MTREFTVLEKAVENWAVCDAERLTDEGVTLMAKAGRRVIVAVAVSFDASVAVRRTVCCEVMDEGAV